MVASRPPDRQRTEQLKASVTKEFKARFRVAANRRQLTESELLRELTEDAMRDAKITSTKG